MYVKDDAAAGSSAKTGCTLSSCIRLLRFTQVSWKLSRSEQLQDYACCAPSEPEVAALASLQYELEIQLSIALL